MAAGAADLHKAINTLWDSSGLESQFSSLWPATVNVSDYTALNDSAARPTQPMPYCVFEQGAGTETDRMSGNLANNIRAIRDIPWEFRVHARSLSGDTRTAKEIASDMKDEILKVFGGHPTVSPQAPSLDNGNFLIAQYQSDFGVRTGDEEYTWTINYLFRIDAPIAV